MSSKSHLSEKYLHFKVMMFHLFVSILLCHVISITFTTLYWCKKYFREGHGVFISFTRVEKQNKTE